MGDEAHLPDVLLVAAIDFGTTFSGYGFSNFDSGNDEEKDVPIFLNKNWGQNLGFQSYKAPTTVLLGPKQEFIAFGFEAMEKYAVLTESEEDNSHYFFEHFKMRLHSDQTELLRLQDIKQDIHLTACNGKTLPALDIFSHALRYLSNHLREAVKLSTGAAIEADNIRWVITVPAIWNDAAKQLMREAAYQAGIASRGHSNRLLIALEPEAASLFCRQLPISHFRGDTANITSLPMDPQERYMVVDCGGGTVDVTVHEIRDDGSVRELHRPTGGPWGGTKVDSNFNKLLDRIFGEKLMNDYRRKFPQENVQLMADFEMKKRSATNASIPLNYNFIRFIEDTSKQNIAKVVSDSGVNGVRFSNGQLRMSEEVIQSLFQPVRDQITSHIQSLLCSPKVSNIKTIFVVGGFGDSPLLRQAVISTVSDLGVRVLVPEEASLAVIKGAVLFGRNPEAIQERVSSRAYGIRTMEAFQEGVHPPEKREVASGLALCKDIFDRFVEVDEVVVLHESKSMQFRAVRDDQTSATIYLYSTSERNAKFTTDPKMRICGQVCVDMPDTRGGKERKIEVKFTFGGTEIEVQAEDLTTHTRVFTTIDFLHS